MDHRADVNRDSCNKTRISAVHPNAPCADEPSAAFQSRDSERIGLFELIYSCTISVCLEDSRLRHVTLTLGASMRLDRRGWCDGHFRELFVNIHRLAVTALIGRASHSQGARDGMLLVDGVWVARSITSGVASGGR